VEHEFERTQRTDELDVEEELVEEIGGEQDRYRLGRNAEEGERREEEDEPREQRPGPGQTLRRRKGQRCARMMDAMRSPEDAHPVACEVPAVIGQIDRQEGDDPAPDAVERKREHTVRIGS